MEQYVMTEALSTPKMGKIRLVGMMLIWLISGILGGPLLFIILPLFIFFLGHKRMHLALFIGFFFVLILADSRLYSLSVFKDFRPVYLVFLSGFIFLDVTLRPVDKFFRVFIPFFLIALLCLINSSTVVTSFLKVISYILVLVAVPTYLNRVYNDFAEEALKYLVYFGVLILTIGLFLWAAGSEIAMLQGRYRGVFGNPNGVGIFSMLFFFLFTIISTYHPDLFSRRKKIGFYAIIIITLLLCQSRSALGGVLLFLFFKQFYRISKVIGVFILIAVIVSYQLILAYLPEIIALLNLESFIRADSLENASGRLVALEFGWDYIKDSILMGGGMGFAEELFHDNARLLNPLGHQGGTHNTYLTIWLDTGLFGLIAFVGAWLVSFLRAAKRSYLVYPLLLAIVFSSFFESWLASSINAFTIILIMILTLLGNPKFSGREA